MTFVAASRKRTEAPRGLARINWEHPSAFGLQDAFLLGPSGTLLVNQAGSPVSATQGTLSRTPTPKGLGLNFSSAAIQTAAPVIYTGGVTALAVVVPTIVDANGRSIIHRRNGATIGNAAIVGSNSSGAWVLNYGSTGIGWGGWASNNAGIFNTGTSEVLPVGRPSVVAASARGNGTNTSIFLDGRKVGSSAQTGVLINTTGFWTEIGGRTGNTNTRYFAGSILFSLHWYRGLDDSELAELTANPWSILEPEKLWVPIVIGGTAYTQSISGVLTPSSSLTQSLRFGAGLSGSTSPSGALRKESRVFRSGSLSPSGVTSKQTNKSPSGSLTASGSLGASTGAEMALAGSITLVGALQQAARYLRSYSSILTPSGALRKMTLKGLSGSIAVTGQLAKGMFLRLTGSIIPSGEVSGFKFTPTISNVISTTLRSIRRFIGRR